MALHIWIGPKIQEKAKLGVDIGERWPWTFLEHKMGPRTEGQDPWIFIEKGVFRGLPLTTPPPQAIETSRRKRRPMCGFRCACVNFMCWSYRQVLWLHTHVQTVFISKPENASSSKDSS